MERIENAPQRPGAPEIIGQALVDFIKTAQGEYLLGAFIKKIQTVDKNASVSEVYRNGGAEFTYWTDMREANPRRYWLVKSGGMNLLLPRPLTRDRFEDLTGFEIKGISPGELNAFVPIQVERMGRNWEPIRRLESAEIQTGSGSTSESRTKDSKGVEKDAIKLEQIRKQIRELIEEARLIEERLSKRK